MFTLLGFSAVGLQTVNQPVFEMKQVAQGEVQVTNTSASRQQVSVTGKHSEIYINGYTEENITIRNYYVAPRQTIDIFAQSGYSNQKFTVMVNNAFAKQFKSAY